jgi:hypothetical protein
LSSVVVKFFLIGLSVSPGVFFSGPRVASGRALRQFSRREMGSRISAARFEVKDWWIGGG